MLNHERKPTRDRKPRTETEAGPQDDDEGDDGVPEAAPEQDRPRLAPLLSLGVGHPGGGRCHAANHEVVVGVGCGVGGEFQED